MRSILCLVIASCVFTAGCSTPQRDQDPASQLQQDPALAHQAQREREPSRQIQQAQAAARKAQRTREPGSHDQEAAKSGVLILGSTPELRQIGYEKMVVWDDAAEAFYASRDSVPAGYGVIEVGRRAIPRYEEARRDRGLPPGSYDVTERAIKALEDQTRTMKREAEELRERLDRLEAARSDPAQARAQDAVDSLYEFGITGISCSPTGELIDCPRTLLPPVPAERCKELLREQGFEDPCSTIVGSQRDSEVTVEHLVQAAKDGDLAEVRNLLDEGVDPNKSHEGVFAIDHAVIQGHIDVVEELLARGVDVNFQDPMTGWTPLLNAVLAPNFEMMDVLLKHGADVTVQFNNGENVFDLIGLSRGDEELIREYLLERSR